MLTEIGNHYQFKMMSLKKEEEFNLISIMSIWKNPNGKTVEINLSTNINSRKSLIVLKSNNFSEEERMVNTRFINDIKQFLLFRYLIHDVKIVGPTIKDMQKYHSLLRNNFDDYFENKFKSLFMTLQKLKYSRIDEENFPKSKSKKYMENYHLRAYLWGEESVRLLTRLKEMKLISFFKNKLGEYEYDFLFQKSKQDKISCYRIMSEELKEMGYDARYGFVLSEVYKERFI